MKKYYEKVSITMPQEDRQFVNEITKRKRCSVSKFFQDIINEYREFELYRRRRSDDNCTLKDL